MDSLTQATLGAAVAEATFGNRRLGNRAIVWGIVLGTLPDLDVLANPWMDQVSRLEWHRGISHSIFLAIVLSPLIAWLITRMHRDQVSWARASVGVFLILFTHSLIDVFTVYGTMIFEPFSRYRAATNNLFIIDPLFTLPLLIGVMVALFLPRESPKRRYANHVGILLACVYVAWSFGAKAIAHERLAVGLRESGQPHLRMMSAPTPFNTVIWRGLAEGDDGFYVGYVSLLEPDVVPTFRRLPKNHELLADLKTARGVEMIAWFSKGYFGVESGPNGLILSDWRFGEIFPAGAPGSAQAIFSWSHDPESEGAKIEPRPLQRDSFLRRLDSWRSPDGKADAP